MIRVGLLGTLAIHGPYGQLTLPTAKTRLLAAYLFWHRERWVQRGELCGLLWPDVEEERAAASLRTALYHFKQALTECCGPGEWLEAERKAVRIAPHTICTVDARLFEEYARKGLRDDGDIESLTAAGNLYRGDFLGDLNGDWCESERQRLADLYLAVLRTLVERLIEAGLYETALLHARRCLMLDSLDERAHQALMKLYAALNQPNKVVAQFEECRRELAAELGVPPSDATVHLFQQLCPFNADQERRQLRGVPSQSRMIESSRSPTHLKFSNEPLINARILLAYCVNRAEAGDYAVAVNAYKTAMDTYERLGGRSALAEAQLLLGKTLLDSHTTWLQRWAARTIKLATTYFREAGSPPERCIALGLYARALLFINETGPAIAVAEEGIAMAHTSDDPDAEVRLLIPLANAYNAQLRLNEAREVMNRLSKMPQALSSTGKSMTVLVILGNVRFKSGDLAGAESALREALAVNSFFATPNPADRYREWMALFQLRMVLHRRGVKHIGQRYDVPADLIESVAEYNIPQCSSFMSRNGDTSAIASTSGWLRANWGEGTAEETLHMVWLLVERMVSVGMSREAAAWSAAGIRLARHLSWPAWVAALSARRAVALAKLGRISAAQSNLRRTEHGIDPADITTVAWSAWAEGLIAVAHGCTDATKQLVHAQRLFADMGNRREADQVAVHLNKRPIERDRVSQLLKSET